MLKRTNLSLWVKKGAWRLLLEILICRWIHIFLISLGSCLAIICAQTLIGDGSILQERLWRAEVISGFRENLGCYWEHFELGLILHHSILYRWHNSLHFGNWLKELRRYVGWHFSFEDWLPRMFASPSFDTFLTVPNHLSVVTQGEKVLLETLIVRNLTELRRIQFRFVNDVSIQWFFH